MVQLRSALVEMARVRLDPDVSRPAWQHSAAVRDQMDGRLEQRLVGWAGGEGQRILVIGGHWPRLVSDLASSGAWVGVVEPDQELRRAVSEVLGATGNLARVTLHDTDYKDRSFDVSAFNAIVAWDVLHTYTEVNPLLKKMVRELKAGGKVFVRSPVRTPVRGRDGRKALRSVLALLPRTDRNVVAEDTFLMPDVGALDADELVAAVESLLVVHDGERAHVVAPDVADLVASGSAPALALKVAMRLDRRLLSRKEAAGCTLALFAAKEKQLGRVFKT